VCRSNLSKYPTKINTSLKQYFDLIYTYENYL